MENIGNNNTVEVDLEAKIASFRGTRDLNIYYEDTDLSGYVYHANYLKYCERARSDLIGVKLVRDLFHKGAHFVVSEANLRYKRPALHGDKLTIKTSLEIKSSPVTLVKQDIYKEDGDKPIVQAEIQLVLVNEKGKPIETPEFMFELIAEHNNNAH
jgi:acyl-CoA thioester hydrolase